MRAQPEPERVVLLAGDGSSTRIVYHALAEELDDLVVILEDPLPRSTLVRRRIVRLGFAAVLGQILFLGFVVPVLRLLGRKRIAELKRDLRLDDSPITGPTVRVPSVNSEECQRALRRLAPRVVIVNGTRIIGTQALASIKVPFINVHAGVTPLYRGVHGGYWALAEGRRELVGTTIHVIDEGIDTGTVIEQPTFDVSRRDSFVTYPYLHTAAGIPALVKTVRRFLEGLEPIEHRVPADLPSKLRYHPTLWGYLATRARAGVR